MSWLKTQLENINSSYKRIIIISIVAILIVVLFFCLSSKDDIIGKYNYYRLLIDGEEISIGDNTGFIEINGVDNKEKCRLYVEMAGYYSMFTGYVFKLPKSERNDGSIMYRFDISSRSGSLIDNDEYIYFNYYPHRGDNGIIIFSSSSVSLYFEK